MKNELKITTMKEENIYTIDEYLIDNGFTRRDDYKYIRFKDNKSIIVSFREHNNEDCVMFEIETNELSSCKYINIDNFIKYIEIDNLINN